MVNSIYDQKMVGATQWREKSFWAPLAGSGGMFSQKILKIECLRFSKIAFEPSESAQNANKTALLFPVTSQMRCSTKEPGLLSSHVHG